MASEVGPFRVEKQGDGQTREPSKNQGYENMLFLPLCIAEGCVEAMWDKDRHKWYQAMEGEMDSLDKNIAQVLIEKPKEQNIVGGKWMLN